MQFCKTCGTQMEDGIKFCPSCGKQVDEQSQSQNQSSNGGTFNNLKNMATNTKDETANIEKSDIEANKAMGGLAYFIFFLPLVSCPNSKYGRFHANQGLLLLILSIVGGIVNSILRRILFGIFAPTYTSFLTGSWGIAALLTSIVSFIIYLPILILGIMGLINGFSGKAKELPFIGKIKIIK